MIDRYIVSYIRGELLKQKDIPSELAWQVTREAEEDPLMYSLLNNWMTHTNDEFLKGLIWTQVLHYHSNRQILASS